jgi:hypothetical protein
MKSIFTIKPAVFGLAVAGFLSATVADAATSIKGDILSFTSQQPTQTLTARPDSFYNLTMGYKGWTHHSAWMYMNLKKGNPYTITVTSQINEVSEIQSFHPAIACWYRPKGQGLTPINYAYDHFYNQFQSIIAKNVTDEATGQKLGTLKMFFVANGYDGDGMDYPLPKEYQQDPVVGILDGVSGKVELSFVPKDTGQYQCVVGGINPNTGLPLNVKYPLEISVIGL